MKLILYDDTLFANDNNITFVIILYIFMKGDDFPPSSVTSEWLQLRSATM